MGGGGGHKGAGKIRKKRMRDGKKERTKEGRGFSIIPPSSESPLKHESASYCSIAHYANYTVNLDSRGDIHCALGPPFPLKIEEKDAYLQNLQRRAAFIVPFTSEE